MTPDDVRKLVQDLIFDDLRRSGFAGTVCYDISNILLGFSLVRLTTSSSSAHLRSS
jgi:hypothetical protein